MEIELLIKKASEDIQYVDCQLSQKFDPQLQWLSSFCSAILIIFQQLINNAPCQKHFTSVSVTWGYSIAIARWWWICAGWSSETGAGPQWSDWRDGRLSHDMAIVSLSWRWWGLSVLGSGYGWGQPHGPWGRGQSWRVWFHACNWYRDTHSNSGLLTTEAWTHPLLSSAPLLFTTLSLS